MFTNKSLLQLTYTLFMKCRLFVHCPGIFALIKIEMCAIHQDINVHQLIPTPHTTAIGDSKCERLIRLCLQNVTEKENSPRWPRPLVPSCGPQQKHEEVEEHVYF